jgi:hypothetical protein
LTEFCKFDIL